MFDLIYKNKIPKIKNSHFLAIIISISIFIVGCTKDYPNEEYIIDCNNILQAWSISSTVYPDIQKQNDLFFPSKEIGYTVGNTSTIMKTSDRGRSWEILAQYYSNEQGINPNALTKARLLTTYFITDEVGFVGGEGKKTYLPNISTTDPVFLKTSDGGNHWEKSYLEGMRNIYDLIFFDDQNGLGLFRKRNDQHDYYTINKTNDGGKTWSDINLDFSRFAISQFIQTPNKIMIATEDENRKKSLYTSTDNGLSWQSNEIPFDHPIGKIYFVDDEVGFLSGGYQTNDGGAHWIKTDMPFDYSSLIHFNSLEQGFIINPIYKFKNDGSLECIPTFQYYEVFQTFDGGENWTKTRIDAECDFTGLQYAPSNDLLFK